MRTFLRAIRFGACQRAGDLSARRFQRHVPSQLARTAWGTWNYAILCRAADLVLLKALLLSLHRSATSLPKLTLIEDHRGSLRDHQRMLSFYPGPLEILCDDEIAAFFHARGDTMLAKCAVSHVFGLKMAAIQKISLESPVLYSDSDVLWFADPRQLLERYSNMGLCLAEDFFRAYNDDLLKEFAGQIEPEWMEAPYGNAGVMVVPKGGFLDEKAREMLNWILDGEGSQGGTRWGHFGNSEQTMLALTARRCGSIVSSNDVCVQAVPRTMHTGSFHGQSWIGRHYVHPVRKQLYVDVMSIVSMARNEAREGMNRSGLKSLE